MQIWIRKGWQQGCSKLRSTGDSQRHFHNAVVVALQRMPPTTLIRCHNKDVTLSSHRNSGPTLGATGNRRYGSFVLRRKCLGKVYYGNEIESTRRMNLSYDDDDDHHHHNNNNNNNKVILLNSQLPSRLIGQIRWNHDLRSRSSFFYDKKQRFTLSKSELFDHVTELVTLLQDSEMKFQQLYSAEERERLRQTLNVNYCYDILERCMEIAKETRQIDAAHQAARLLQAMKEISTGNGTSSSSSDSEESARDGSSTSLNDGRMSALTPTTSFYNVVLQSYAVCDGKKEAAIQAQTILEEMLQRCYEWMSSSSPSRTVTTTTTTTTTTGITPPPPPPPPAPTVKTFNIVVNTWAKSRQKDSGFKAQKVVDMMHKWDVACRTGGGMTQKQYRGAKANDRTLVSVVDAWSKSRHPKAAEYATSILFEAIEESKQNSYFLVGPPLFHAVLGAWVRSSTDSQAGERAEEILYIMEQCAGFKGAELRPGTRAYALVMEVWMRREQAEKQGRGADRAEALLRTMTDIYRRDHEAYIKPNKICFTNCVSAWSLAQSRKDAPERAEALVNLLIDIYSETNDDDFRPDLSLYNTVITVWTRAINRPNSMERAKKWLSALRKHSEPDLVTYNTILDGMGKRGMSGEALNMLEWLEMAGQNSPHLLPDQITFNNTLLAVARDKSCAQPWVKASSLLQKMIESEEKSKSKRATPDRISYTLLISSLLGADGVKLEDVLHAEELLQHSLRMQNERGWDCKLDTYLFATLMQACGEVQGTMEDRDRALHVALAAMEYCKSGRFGEVNHITFASCMTAIGQLCHDETKKTALLRSLFEICAAEGHVSNQIIMLMKTWVWKDEMPSLQAKFSRNVSYFRNPKAGQQNRAESAHQ